MPTTFNTLQTKARDWQREAFVELRGAKFNGTVVAATGTGKSFLIAMQVVYIIEMRRTTVIKIYVPRIALADQISRDIKSCVDVTIAAVGSTLDTSKINKEQVEIIVQNTALLNAENGNPPYQDVAIIDECHEAREGLMKVIEAPVITRYTATPKDEGTPQSPIIYNYTQRQAINDNVIEDYVVHERLVKLDVDERDMYNEMTANIAYNMQHFKSFSEVKQSLRGKGRKSASASAVMNAIVARNRVMASSRNKCNLLINMLESELKGQKNIAFTQYKDTIQLIEGCLTSAVCFYTGKGTSKKAIERYKKTGVDSLLAPQAFDYGIDIPDMSNGIITGLSSDPGKYIQRVGRVLRKKKGPANLYIILCEDTVEKDNYDDIREREQSKPV